MDSNISCAMVVAGVDRQMGNKTIAWVVIALIQFISGCGGGSGSATATIPDVLGTDGSVGSYYTVTAIPVQPRVVNVAPSDAANLQVQLDANDVVVLEAIGDYRTGGPSQLTVSSNKTIIGGYGTRVPQIIIPGGSSNVTIDGVTGCGWTCRDIKFAAGDPIKNITIVGGSYGPGYNIFLGFDSGAQVEGLRATYIGGIDAQLTVAGYIRNSVFQAIASYAPGINISMVGNTTTPSYGNAIVSFASTTPGGAANISTFGDLYVLQANVESWDCFQQDLHPYQKRALIFSNMDSLRMAGTAGGRESDCVDTGAMLDISSTPSVVQWLDASNGGPGDADDAYLSNIGTHILIQADNSVTRSYAQTPGNILETLRTTWPVSEVSLNGLDISNGTTLTPAASNAMVNAYLGAPKTTAPVKPVPRVVDTFPGWKENLAPHPDSAPAIQALINRDHIVKLASGKYYLDSPLQIGTKMRDANGTLIVEGIIGAGKDSVYLIAKGQFPVIQVRDDDTADVNDRGMRLVLEGLSIYGGTYGLDYTNPSGYDEYTSPTLQVNWSSFRNLAFNHQILAGVHFQNSYGIDNNIWYKVDFNDMPVAFMGIGYRSTTSGEHQLMNYADKQYFIDNQYHNISEAVWNWDAYRPSNSNVWIDSYFDNVGSISKTRSAWDIMWVNSVFNNITGPTAIDLLDTGSTASRRFEQLDCLWTGTGPAVVTDTQSGYLGTLFIDTEFNQSGGSIVATSGKQTLHAWNSKITGTATVGNVSYGAFINSRMGNFNKTISYVVSDPATHTIDLVNTPASPYRQVLSR